MSGSRRFLFLLVLACVTGVVLVQIALDWKTSGIGIFTAYSENSEKEISNFKYKNINGTGIPAYPGKELVHSTKKYSTPKSLLIASTSLPKSTKDQTIKIIVSSNRSQVRTLTFGRSLAQQKPSQQLMSRQDRLRELLKQSVVVHKGPTLDPMRSLKPIPLANPEKVMKIFILTYFRSGSSFVGDILQQNWKTFYHFEPLHSMTYNNPIHDSKAPEVFNFFNDIFNCNFSNQTAYMDWVRQPRNQFLFAHNLFLWVTCHSNPKTCFNASFVDAVCKRSSVHVIKLTRLRMRHLRNYLESYGDKNIKVVFLTRDPRGILSSRWHLDWCIGSNCSDPNVLCHEMNEDLNIFEELQRQQPNKFIKIRYEDLSMNPELETQKLFQFLQLLYSPSVKKFLKTHTMSRKIDNNPYTTRRNSTAMVSKWRERITYSQALQVQTQCKEVLHKLNHSLITSPNELTYPNGIPTPKTITLSPKSEIKKSITLRKRNSKQTSKAKQ